MKRYLAFLLALVMLFSVFGGITASAAESDADASSDTLIVYTKSGATRTFHVGDTFTYTYWLKITGYDLGQFSAHILYDSKCVSLESWTCPNFPNQRPGTYSNKAGDFRFHTAADLAVFNSVTPQQLIECTFKVVRGGTTYIRPILEELEAESISGGDRPFVRDFIPAANVTNLYATYDRLQNETPSSASTKLTEREDVVWYYAYDNATGTTIPAGVEFLLTGTSDTGANVQRTATTDEYGYLCFGRVPFGDYYIQCNSTTADGAAYLVTDDTLHLPYVVGTVLTLDNELYTDCVAADALRTLEVTFKWLNEEISEGETYTGDRPESLYMELSCNGKVYASRTVKSNAGSVTFQNLRKTDAAGSAITYELAVSTLDQYQTEITPTANGYHVDFVYLNNHTWETTRVDPTCSETGYIESVCSDCGATNYTTLSALGHDYAVSGTPASCTEYGYTVSVCKRCGLRFVEQTAPLGHQWSAWTVTKDATATEDGERVHTCLRCGVTEMQLMPGPSHQHTYVLVEKDATCTEPGYVEKRCACGALDPTFQRAERPALGHDYSGDSSIVEIKSPTCTEEGVMEYTCSRCGEIHDEILPKLGHNWELIYEEPATCDTIGKKEYKCGNCGDTKTVTTPALGHNWGDWIIDIEATTTTDGTKHRICRTCGARQDEVIPKLTHVCEYTIVEVVPPTCTEPGYTRYKCVCGASFIDKDSHTEATGHSWKEIDRVAATERTQGVVTYQCENCERYDYKFLPKLPANWKNPFWDVNTTDWFYEQVCYVAQNQLMVGTSDTRFSPNETMSRGMLVTVLYRMAGQPQIPGMSSPFTDVYSSDYYHDAVAWAYTCQIVAGISETQFAPNEDITREQMVAIFYRYALFQDYDTSAVASLSRFPDADMASEYAIPALKWSVGAGVISGVATKDGILLQPKENATRAEAATVIMKFDMWRLSAAAGS